MVVNPPVAQFGRGRRNLDDSPTFEHIEIQEVLAWGHSTPPAPHDSPLTTNPPPGIRSFITTTRSPRQPTQSSQTRQARNLPRGNRESDEIPDSETEGRVVEDGDRQEGEGEGRKDEGTVLESPA